MELYLDSADIKEIEEAFKLGFLTGLTTTPTFMHREGITDIDAMILKLADIVPILQVEALGETVDEICGEAYRLLELGLDKKKTVFKIPVSLVGCAACKKLRNDGILVNIHLVYTIQQAYMAMQAGASYVCPLVGRLQDQGVNALELVEQCVEAVNYYGYDCKIMFSSVRNVEHVRNAMQIGVHTITVPWKLMNLLTENYFTTIGTQQFFEHTKLMTMTVRDIMSDKNPLISEDATIMETLIAMTTNGFGAVMVVNKDGGNLGVFTDGDLRRKLQSEGGKFMDHKMGELEYNTPISIEPTALLIEASDLFKSKKVDTISIVENDKQVGMLDIQDLLRITANNG